MRENWQAVARRYVTALAVAVLLAVIAQPYYSTVIPCQDTSWLCVYLWICDCNGIFPP